MATDEKRGISSKFLRDFQAGLLSPILERVKLDRTMCLELRAEYVNIYYRGGNLMKISRSGDHYSAFFDEKYFDGDQSAPGSELKTSEDVTRWLDALPRLKQGMDLFLGVHQKDEREIQQLIVRDNNFGSIARSTDFYFCDIEYANEHGRFDMIAVRWPSSSAERKKQDGLRLVLVEVKNGDNALDGTAGLHAHVTDVNNHLSDPTNVARLKSEMVTLFNQKRSLGLIDCGKDMRTFSDEGPLLLLLLANHDPDKSRLRELLQSLPPSPHAEIQVAYSCLLGYGLYEPAILAVDQALEGKLV